METAELETYTTMAGMGGGASFGGPDNAYRYSLDRYWGANGGYRMVNWILLNPSTADATENDPTVRKGIGFSQRWGFDGMVFTNVFALRSTDPSVLATHANPVGSANDTALIRVAQRCQLHVAAWGVGGKLWDTGKAVKRRLEDYGFTLYHLGLTQDGYPKHPLYLPYETPLEVWR